MFKIGPFLGMQTKLDPVYNKDGYGSYAIDADMARGTLRPMRTDRHIADDTGNTLFLEDCCLKTFDGCVSIQRDTMGKKNRIFATGIMDYPISAHIGGDCTDWCADKYCKLGFPCFEDPPDVTYHGSSVSEREAETRNYTYRYENCFGEKSGFAPPSPNVLVNFDVQATISGFAYPDDEYCITHINIYMLKSGVGSDEKGTSDNMAHYLFIDRIPVSEFSYTHSPINNKGVVVNNDVPNSFVPVPTDARDIQYYGEKQLAFLSGDYVRFTGIDEYGKPNFSVAPVKYAYEPRHKPVRFLCSENLGFILTCGNPEVLDLKLDCDLSGIHKSTIIQEKIPLIGRASPAIFNDGVVYASTEGIVYLRGSDYILITKGIWTREEYDSYQPQTMKGVVYNGYYYGTTSECSFRILLPSSILDDYNNNFTYLSIDATAYYVTTDNRLMYCNTDGTHEFGQGDDFKEYTFESKDYFSETPINISVFRYFGECGEIDVDVKVDGLTCLDYHDVFDAKSERVIRLGRSRGYNHSFKLTGTSEIRNVTMATSISAMRQ